MRLNWRCLTAILFFLVSTPAYHGDATALDDSTKSVLILNSYHPGYAWSDAEQAGILDTFRAQNPHWVPFIEYLDCKRRPGGEHLEELTRLLHRKYHDQNLSLVIPMDNPSLEFALKNRAKLFENSPVVFCGINDFTPSMLDGHSNVTGIAENIDIGGTIEAMLRLHPATREILVLHDYTVTGLAVRKEVEDLVPRFSQRGKFRFIDRLDMEDVLRELERLPKDSLVLEIGFIADKSGRTFGLTETTDLFVKHSAVPVYGAYEARLGHGIIGGKLISAGIHGAHAARMALRVLAGEKASDIPVATESDARFMFDYRAMARFGIRLSALPENSIVINQPVSFYAAHRTVIHFALAAIAFLFAIIVLLTINIAQRRRSTMILRQSEYRQRAILDNIPDPAWLKDKDGRHLAVNEAWCKVFSLNSRQVIGKTGNDLFSAEAAKKFQEEDDEVVRHGRQLRQEESLMDKQGGVAWYDTIKAPITNEQGIIIGTTGITRNITKRKQAEEALRKSEAKYKEIFENITDVFYRTDNEGLLLIVSPSVEQLLGYVPDEVIGKKLSEFYINPEQRDQFLSVLREKGEVKGYEARLRAKDGSVVWVSTNAQSFRDKKGRIIGVQGIARDITERKQAEEALRESEEKAKRTAEVNRTMAEIGRIISSTLNIEDVYEQFAAEVKKIIPFDQIVIGLINQEQGTYHFAYTSGLEIPERHKGKTLPLPGIVREVIRKRSLFLLEPENEKGFVEGYPEFLIPFATGVRSIMAAPLISRDQVVGVLYLASRGSNAYTDRDVQLAENVAIQISGAIASAQLYAEITQAEEERRLSEVKFMVAFQSAPTLMTISALARVYRLFEATI